MENVIYDAFDAAMARDWAKALVFNQTHRKPLDRLNNQIQTVPTKDYIEILTGIEILADILGAELKEGVFEDGRGAKYFVFQGEKFVYPPEGKALRPGRRGAAVSCEVGHCAYCQDGRCSRESVSHGWKTSGEFRNGERVSYPVCMDYADCKEPGDDGDD